MSCKMCQERGKTWNGSDPVCAFPDFSGNWNCATVNAIRDICYEGQNPMPHGVDYQYCDDMKYATIRIDGIENGQGNHIGLALWVCWYKSRGGTDAMLVLDSDGARQPTEEELLAIIAAYSQKGGQAMSNGKGSAPRNLGPKFRENYDAIFRKAKKTALRGARSLTKKAPPTSQKP